MKSLSNMGSGKLSRIRALLFDLDGTFVTEGVLEARTYKRLEEVRKVGIKTIAVTGRPAGWCDLIARWWPVDAVVGENGAFSYFKKKNKILRKTFHETDTYSSYQSKLNLLFQDLLSKYDYLKLAADQSFRHWDLAIDIAEETQVSMDVAINIVKLCEKQGASAAISNIHINIWFGDYNKENMSIKVLDDFGISKDEAIYIGDSPNDSPLFDCFPISVGVSSVSKYNSIMSHLPTYITKADAGEGFIELVDSILLTK